MDDRVSNNVKEIRIIPYLWNNMGIKSDHSIILIPIYVWEVRNRHSYFI